VIRVRLARIGGGIALALGFLLVLRLIAIDNLEALFFVLPAIGGGGLALWLAGDRPWLIVATFLIAGTAAISLIGGVGLLFLPSIVLLMAAAISKGPSVSA
jgi:hypothetical protein